MNRLFNSIQRYKTRLETHKDFALVFVFYRLSNLKYFPNLTWERHMESKHTVTIAGSINTYNLPERYLGKRFQNETCSYNLNGESHQQSLCEGCIYTRAQS
jgi:hypothetical protein